MDIPTGKPYNPGQPRVCWSSGKPDKLKITNPKFAEPVLVGLSTESGVLSLLFRRVACFGLRRPRVTEHSIRQPER